MERLTAARHKHSAAVDGPVPFVVFLGVQFLDSVAQSLSVELRSDLLAGVRGPNDDSSDVGRDGDARCLAC